MRDVSDRAYIRFDIERFKLVADPNVAGGRGSDSLPLGRRGRAA